ncbi:MAG: HTH domain-containing protein [Oscillospiraceae bacterium]|nr:HTH domain-containing protein [Oscillospiraceae bacterium]
MREITVNPKITADELSKIISVTSRTIERNLRQLKEKNLLERAGSDKNGEWIINQ